MACPAGLGFSRTKYVAGAILYDCSILILTYSPGAHTWDIEPRTPRMISALTSVIPVTFGPTQPGGTRLPVAVEVTATPARAFGRAA